MSLADKVAEKILGPFGWVLIKTLTRIAVAIEKGIDSYREISGYNPIFAPPAEPLAEPSTPAGGIEQTDYSSDPEPDYMRLEILEALARENRIIILPDTDLVALGKQRGWLNEAGEVVMLPQGYGD